MITDKQIEEYFELESRATAGPWRSGKWAIDRGYDHQIFVDALEVTPVPSCTLLCDAEFIAASRNAFRALLTEVKESREVISAISSGAVYYDGKPGKTPKTRAAAHRAKFGGGE